MKYVLAGIVGGIIGGMGMGAGTLLVPIMTLMLGVEQRTTQLINTIAFMPMAVLTLIINIKAGYIKWKYILYVCVSGTLSAIGSSMLVGVIEPTLLRKIFGVFLIVLALYFIITTIYGMVMKKRKETLTSINVTKEDDDD